MKTKEQETQGMIHVWLKRPGGAPEKKFIPNTLEFLQWFVEGYIETYTLSHDLVVICNEEGKLDGLPYNCTICGEAFVGNILLVGTNEDEFDDVPFEEETLRSMLPGFFKS